MQLCGSLNIIWHCLSLEMEWKLTFSSPVATAEFSKFAGILSAALSQHHFCGLLPPFLLPLIPSFPSGLKVSWLQLSPSYRGLCHLWVISLPSSSLTLIGVVWTPRLDVGTCTLSSQSEEPYFCWTVASRLGSTFTYSGALHAELRSQRVQPPLRPDSSLCSSMAFLVNHSPLSCFCSVVVITFASHAKGPQFETRWKQISWLALVAQTVKVFACNAGHLGSIPGLGRSPGEGKATYSSILAWRIPRTQESDTTDRLSLFMNITN